MFYVSKIFWLLAQPLSLGFILVSGGTILVFAGFRRLGTTICACAALVLFLTLYTTVGNGLLQVLEDKVARPSQEPASLACMIVLGGAIENEVMSGRGGIELNAAADRYTEALRLALAHPEAKILVSGGDGSFSGAYEGEAGASERFFSAYGISPDRLIKENTSRNTYENTTNTKVLLDRLDLHGCLLVTSAFHMPRSMALFKKAGIPVQPWPVDYRTSGQVSLGFDFSQPSLNAQNTATAIREWLGLLGYWLTGRIDRP